MSSVIKGLFELLIILPELLFRLVVDIFRLIGLLIELAWDQLLFLGAELLYGDLQFVALAALALTCYLCWQLIEVTRLWLGAIVFLPLYMLLFWLAVWVLTFLGLI